MTSEEMLLHAWANQSAKMDWLGMEKCLRELIREYRLGKAVNAQADPNVMLEDFAEVIAAYTKRGKP